MYIAVGQNSIVLVAAGLTPLDINLLDSIARRAIERYASAR